MTRRPRPAETPECRRGRDGGPPRGLSHCAVFRSFEPAPLLRDADFAAKCRERACIAHFHGTAFHGSDPCSLGTWLAEARIRAFSVARDSLGGTDGAAERPVNVWPTSAGSIRPRVGKANGFRRS